MGKTTIPPVEPGNETFRTGFAHDPANASAGTGTGTRAEYDARIERARINSRKRVDARKAKQAETQDSTLGLETPEITGKSRAKKTPLPDTDARELPPKKSHHKKQPQPVSKTQASEAVAVLFEMLRVATGMVGLGPDAMPTPMERAFIEPSLTRLIERYGSVAEQFSWLFDPLMLAVGVGLYGVRLSAIVRDQMARNKPPDETPPNRPPSPNVPPDPGNNGARVFSPEELFSMTGDLHHQ